MAYELMEPEASVYEESTEKKFRVEDAVVMLVSVEKGVVKPGGVTKLKGENGTLAKAELNTFGETVHSLREVWRYNIEFNSGGKQSKAMIEINATTGDVILFQRESQWRL